MKTFKQLIAEVAQPNNEDELNFKEKHSIEVIDHPASEERQHSAEKVSPKRRADYDKGEDEEVYEAKMDPVGKEDDDIDNDGDTDSSDEYLHARRKAIAKAMKKEAKLDPVGKEDDDIDNDGDTDSSDEYLHARRKAIAKAMRESIRSITEKAKSEAQQKAAAIALAVKRGDKPKSELIGASKEMYNMSEKDLEDFARTSHKGIPARVNEADDFAGWIAIYNGKKLEITKDKAKDLYGAKMYAAKELRVPKSKMGLLAIKTAYNEEFDLTEDANKMLAIGRKLQAMAAKEKNDMIANAMAKLADHLEAFGAPFGPKNMADLVKKTGLKAEVITSLIKRANVNEEVELDDKEFPVTIDPKTAKKIVKNLDENFKVGIVKLNDGSSIIVKDQDARLLNRMFADLNADNKNRMMKVAMADKNGFNEILGFAREALQ